MDAAGLFLSMLALAPAALSWLGREAVAALAGAGAALVVLFALRGLRRRAGRSRGLYGADPARVLKERLRRRLTEPADAFAGPPWPGPTVGAGDVLDADLEAASRQVLPEAGWRPGAARHVLRRRLNGGAPNGAANGAEAAQWRQLGALALLDDTQSALMAYARAADLAPDEPDLQMLLGVLYLRTGRLEAAEAAFRRQMGLVNGKDSGEAVRYRAGIMLGDVLLTKGAREEALAAYEAARKEVLALIEREPANPHWHRYAAAAHDRVGDLALADGQFDMALECFRRSLELADTLAKSDSANSDLQHDLSVAHDRVGEALDLQGNAEGALRYYRRSLELAEALMKREPNRAEWRWGVSASLDRIGDALAARSETAEALTAYRRGLKLAEAAAAGDPARLDWQRDLAVTCHKVGMLEAQCGREAEAREVLEQGRAVIARLAEIARYRAQWRADLSKFDAALRTLE